MISDSGWKSLKQCYAAKAAGTEEGPLKVTDLIKALEAEGGHGNGGWKAELGCSAGDAECNPEAGGPEEVR